MEINQQWKLDVGAYRPWGQCQDTGLGNVHMYLVICVMQYVQFIDTSFTISQL